MPKQKRVHIVEKYHSFAMQRQTLPLMNMIGVEVTRGEEVDETADVNIHMPWHFLADHEPGDSKHVIVYTHENPGSSAAIYQTCRKADFITVLSFQGRQRLVSMGIDPRKIRVAYCGADHTQFRRRNIGIVASKQPNGRKRGHILLDLAWRMDRNWLSLFQFVIVGTGWEQLVEECKAAGLNIVLIPGIDDDEQMLEFYHQFDVLLSTGYEEGGPLPIIEAMKAGVPILTPDYGYANDLITGVDKYDTLEELERKLIAMFEHDIENARIGAMLTWRSYTEEYALILNDLLGVQVKEVKDSGTPRYAKLLQIVDEVKPRNILEIGTWSGKRASQMIQRAAGFRPIETIRYLGFDLFEEMTEDLFMEELSKIPPPIMVAERFLGATGADIKLVKGHSAATVPAEKWDYNKADFVFIDGGHRADTIRLDWENVQKFLHEKSVIVFDDYYLDRPKELEGYGCNDLLAELGPEWKVWTHNESATMHDNGRLKTKIALVEVKRNA